MDNAPLRFKLDTDYFNRAGDKVRYVGQLSDGRCQFRKGDGPYLLTVGADGFCVSPRRKTDYDILDKWEITDDPDRVYLFPNDDHEYRGSELENFDSPCVEKILIKPQFVPDKNRSVCPYCLESRLLDAPHTCRYPYWSGRKAKISPLVDDTLTDQQWHMKMEGKINEIIARLNE